MPSKETSLLVLLALVAACESPRDEDGPFPNPARPDALATDGPVAPGGPGARNNEVEAGAADGSEPGDAGPQPGCPEGQHLCANVCVANVSAETCGVSCGVPCPTPTGGTATCDGTKCGGACPAGNKLCLGDCVPEGQPCAGDCPPGTHHCDGLCVENTSVNACGLACSPCAVPPGGKATCDGNRCGIACDAGKACGDRCGECCAPEDCAPKEGFVATCETTSLTCQYGCPGGQKACGNRCIPAAACCEDGDCPPKGGQVGKCDASSGQCQWMCAGDTKPCGGACVPNSGCCNDASCPGGFACINHGCSTSQCRSGYKPCAGRCIPTSACCSDDECLGNFACSGNACSKTRCRNGYKTCNGECIPASGCCSDSECTGNFACQNNACSTSQCRGGHKPCGNRCIPNQTCCRNQDCDDGNACTTDTCGSSTCSNTKIAGCCRTRNDCSDQQVCDDNTCRACGGRDQRCCPDNACRDGRTCQAGTCKDAPPPACMGTEGQWSGCRGTGCGVCAELVQDFPLYFANHPGCERNTTCAGQYFSCNQRCPAPESADRCDGTEGQWAGCRGTGCWVCTELVKDYPKYFTNHPHCVPNANCEGLSFTCNARCPAPTEADR